MNSRRRAVSCLLLAACAASVASASEVAWPTSLAARAGLRPEDYLQPTVSGRPESAVFGMVREEGRRFHEGVDIRPSAHDSAGEALDLVLAAMDGEVAYANAAVNGPYGRYVVLTHRNAELPVYTLYAHLATLAPGAKVGLFVSRGTTLGRMGRSSAGATPITPDRAHLHFEVGLVLSKGFPRWYAAQPDNRGSRNLHGLFNGQNLIGMDPMPLLTQSRVDLLALHRSQPVAVTVALRASQIPDFVRRHPMLVHGEPSGAAGWYVEFSWQGMPLSWKALEAGHPQLPPGRWKLLEIDPRRREQLIHRQMLAADGRSPGDLLRQNVEILLTPPH